MSVKPKIIKSGVEARELLLAGVEFGYNNVAPTLGKYGQNFLLEKGNNNTNDGKKILAALWIEDEIKQRGLSVAREASIKTEGEVNDASTTAYILTYHIMKECARLLPNRHSILGKYSTGELIKKVTAEVRHVYKFLDEMAEPIKSREQLIESALVSTENEEIAQLIGSMQWDLTKDGRIIAEETIDPECSIERVSGIRIDNGMSAPIAMNNFDNQSLDIEDSLVLLTNYEMIDFDKQLNRIVAMVAAAGKNKVTVVARAFNSPTLKAIGTLQSASGFQIFPINSPYTDMNEVMKDLAAVHGGTYVHNESMDIDAIQLSDLGYAKTIVAKRWDSIFTGPGDEKSKERVEKRLKELHDLANGKGSQREKDRIHERIAQLRNGFAILRIGSDSDTDRLRLKDKADDAVGAVRHALAEGVVPGAGLAFKAIAETLPDDYIIKKPLLVINQLIMASAPKDFVVPEWVKDPVKVLKTALKYSSNVAVNLATAAGADATALDKPRYVQEADQPQDDE